MSITNWVNECDPLKQNKTKTQFIHSFNSFNSILSVPRTFVAVPWRIGCVNVVNVAFFVVMKKKKTTESTKRGAPPVGPVKNRQGGFACCRSVGPDARAVKQGMRGCSCTQKKNRPTAVGCVWVCDRTLYGTRGSTANEPCRWSFLSFFCVCLCTKGKND